MREEPVPEKDGPKAAVAASAEQAELEAAVPRPEGRTAPAAAAVTPVEVKPPQADSGDLTFHLNAGKKYFARKKYVSAAAEYKAALKFLPAGDAREVYLFERQGAAMLKAGKEPAAQKLFLSAINKAKELGTSGSDLANAYLGLGYCLEKANKISGAISNYEKAMELSGSKTVKARLADTISGLKKVQK